MSASPQRAFAVTPFEADTRLKSRKPEPEIETYLGTLVEPSEYRAYVTHAEVYWHRGWKRWTCILKHDLFDGNLNRIAQDIPIWFALGNNKERPRAGRGSKYFKAWHHANGDSAPRRNSMGLLSPSVFKHRYVRV